MAFQSIIFASVVAGIVATAGMSLFVLAFRQLGVLHADPIQAIGSAATGSLGRAIPLGWLIHVVAGISFAALYTLFFWRTGLLDLSAFPILIASAMTGFGHGLVVGFFLVISVGEHHPMRRFRSDGIELAGVYFAAHVIFGLLVGATLIALGPLAKPS